MIIYFYMHTHTCNACCLADSDSDRSAGGATYDPGGGAQKGQYHIKTQNLSAVLVHSQALLEERKLFCFVLDHLCSVIHNEIAYNASVSQCLTYMCEILCNAQEHNLKRHRLYSVGLLYYTHVCRHFYTCT